MIHGWDNSRPNGTTHTIAVVAASSCNVLVGCRCFGRHVGPLVVDPVEEKKAQRRLVFLRAMLTYRTGGAIKF